MIMRSINKKGNLDNMSIIVGLFVLTIAIFIGYKIVNLGADAFAGDATASTLMSNADTMFNRLGNSGFLFMVIGLFLFNIIGAFLMFTSPVFIILDILLMPISIFIAAIVSNAYEASIYTFTEVGAFSVMNFIMLHLPSIIVVMDILVALTAYALVKDRYG